MTIIRTASLAGIAGLPLTIEVQLLRRLPSVVIIGLPGGQVREVADRVRSAIGAAGLPFPQQRVAVDVTPGASHVGGVDLPIALGVLAAAGQWTPPDGWAFIGELSLAGQVRAVRGTLARVEALRDAGVSTVVVPPGCGAEALLAGGVSVLEARTLADVLAGHYSPPVPAPEDTGRGWSLDLSEVRGLHHARRGLEIAAAGGHSLVLGGPVGAGKTMIAARLPGILPPLSLDEQRTATRIASAAGLLSPGAIIRARPFRAPHHTISMAGMLGARGRPGEASLAHAGVLFLDEVVEFQRPVLFAARLGLASGAVVSGGHRIPAAAQLVVSVNPCACGRSRCTCAPEVTERYQAHVTRAAGALTMRANVRPVAPDVLRGPPGEDSATVRARVVAARARQESRGRLNEDTTEPMLSRRHGGGILKDLADVPADERLRLLRIAATVADLEGASMIKYAHLLEAGSYLNPVPA